MCAVRWWLTISIALAGCSDPEPVDLCELGERVYSDALASLRDDSPSCTRDDECVLLRTDVDCNGFAASLCGDVVHRDVAAKWDPATVCAPLNAYPPADQQCAIQASCAGGEPFCDRGRCAARVPGVLDASPERDARTDAR